MAIGLGHKHYKRQKINPQIADHQYRSIQQCAVAVTHCQLFTKVTQKLCRAVLQSVAVFSG